MSETKVYKKRPHRKVKSGCATCKRRKIKCDEEKPQCSNCARYSAECVYPSSNPSTPLDYASLSTSTTPPPIETPESIIEEPPIPQSPSGVHDLPIRDLMLMHHWSISTCFGFGDGLPGAVEPWRVDIPIMGQRHHFIMRGILAVTALHMSRDTADIVLRNKYVQLAAYHQDLALPEYRAALANVTESNVTAILAFSVLTTVYSIAAPREAGTFFSAGAPEWLFLHRGVGDIPMQWQAWIDNSPMGQQMQRRRLGFVEPTLNPEDYRLESLHDLFTTLPPEEHGDALQYDQALRCLRQAFAHTFCLESRIGPKFAVLLWIERVGHGYLELLSLHKPHALVLFAHCCILLKRASTFWQLEGSAERTLLEMKSFLAEEFLPWIEWPLRECGLV